MKIIDVELVTVPYGHGVMLLVVVHTDDGDYGIGEVGTRSHWRAVRGAVDDFADELLGADPSRTEHLWQLLTRPGIPTAGLLGAVLAAIDVALWDIQGKVLGVPLYQLLGGASRDHVECYVHVYGADQDTLVREAQTLVAAGWRYLRISLEDPAPGARYTERAAVRSAIATVQGLRETLGEDVELLLDVRSQLDSAQALTLCRELEPFRPFFVDDPLRNDKLDGYRALRLRTGVSIAAGQQLTAKWQFRSLIEDELIDHVRVNVANTGLTEARKISAMAETHHINLAAHNPLGPVTAAASAHLNMALPNVSVQEQATRTFEDCPLFTAMPQLRPGRIIPTHRPGLGVDLDLDAARRLPLRGPASLPRLQHLDGSFTNW